MNNRSARTRPAAALLLACAASIVLGGCAAAPASRSGTSWRAGFHADLRACQTAQGGRLAQRRRVESSHPRVSACLRQRGWAPDGTPSLARMLSPG